MNFLAHLYLADPTPASLIGNLLPDLVRGRPDPAWPADVLEGARHHRRIDAFTDTHPLFARSKGRIFAEHGRFSGILVDIFYDHFLSRDWDRYHARPLPEFVDQCHQAMLAHPDLMPAAMRPIIECMAEQQWLLCYRDADGLRLTLTRMSRRFSERFEREINLAAAVDLLEDRGEALAADFHTFFPQLIDFSRSRRTMAAQNAVW